ncbi:hypothetical protein PLICRDRAFT_49601 [Plicaturopsis crispa FD-325 SS-3]|nr:hypothetical protein PLICRDRAFT_49601 [Plicaturopsis crispa FD-325 SS-3]
MSAGLKPLPPLARQDKLPPTPPTSSDFDDPDFSPPPLPPKIQADSDSDTAQFASSGPLPSLPSLGAFDHGLNVPLTPTSPGGSSPTSPLDTKPKKSNPLIDLVETEKQYVDQLTGVIRKVAAAWSRSNLPPPELDTMFRSIESVYKANRSLLSKLKEIGSNPSSPKALGDLLMRWIDDLDTPYTNYSTKYLAGFDAWEPVQSNARLHTILATFSAANPPPLSALASYPSGDDTPTWTLDALFLLPKARLKYYRKLYSRLLKSTTPGRSDHRLLVGALDKLDTLMNTLDDRANITVGGGVPMREEEEEEVIDLRTQSVVGRSGGEQHLSVSDAGAPGSAGSSTRGSSLSGGERLSRETASTSISRGSTATMSMPISDLERRLATDRCLDIFTMKPKSVRLQMNPSTLTYTRELRVSTDVLIRLTPRATGEEVVHRHGHIFILSDLFLVCERMTPSERARAGVNGPDMWLCYPPLAGKVLRVSEVPGNDMQLQVAIMRKETLTLQVDSLHSRNSLIAEFKDCIEFAGSIPPPSKTPPPPVPSLAGMSRSPSLPLDNLASPPPLGSLPPTPGSVSSGHRASSPVSSPHSRPISNDENTRNMSNLVLSPEAQVQQGAQRVPAMHNPLPASRISEEADRSSFGQISRTDSRGSNRQGSPPSWSPNQGIPHIRSNSRGGEQGPPPSSFGPGQVVSPLRVNSRGGDQSPPSFSPGQVMRPPMQRTSSMGSEHMPMGFGPGQVIPPQRGASITYQQPPQQFHPGPGYGPNPNMGGPPPNFQRPMPPGPPPNQPPQGYPPQQRVQFAPGYNGPPPGRPPSAPTNPSFQGGVRNAPSSASLRGQYDQRPAPPLPPGGYPPNNFGPPSDSYGSLAAPQPRAMMPSAQLSARELHQNIPSFHEPSPPNSPVQETPPYVGPVTNPVTADMKCKIFLQQQHAQWKSLGAAKLRLYHQQPTNIKQLVVEADNKAKTILISTIVLTDGVERVGKTGVAVELSDAGTRTGIIYMIQLRNESSAGGLFDRLLAGSDRAGGA